MRRAMIFIAFTLLPLVPPSIAAAGRQAKAREAWRWAEGLLREAPAMPAKHKAHYGAVCPQEELSNAEEAIRRVMGKYGPTSRAYVDLGNCQMRRGRFSEAAGSFEHALHFTPSNPSAQAGHQAAMRLLRIVAVVRPQLPLNHQVIQLLKFRGGSGESLWLVLTAKLTGGFPTVYTGLHLAVLREIGLRHHSVWESKEQHVSDSELGGMFAQVCLLQPASDGSPQVALWEVAPGGSIEPSHVSVFLWDHSRLRKIFGVEGTEPIWIEDLNNDGRYEIGNYYEIGRGLSHCDMPRWTDIYAYKHGCWALANKDFPREYRGWSRRLRKLLKKNPDEDELLEYMGVLRDIQGKPKAALAWYHRAERVMLDWKQDSYTRARLGEIRNRIRRLEHRQD